jgi:hypothetical protein
MEFPQPAAQLNQPAGDKASYQYEPQDTLPWLGYVVHQGNKDPNAKVDAQPTFYEQVQDQGSIFAFPIGFYHLVDAEPKVDDASQERQNVHGLSLPLF